MKRSGMFFHLTRVQISLRVPLILVISTFGVAHKKLKYKEKCCHCNPCLSDISFESNKV